MFRGIRKFVQSPAGMRVIAYIAPLLIGWILSKLQGKDTKSTKQNRRRK